MLFFLLNHLINYILIIFIIFNMIASVNKELLKQKKLRRILNNDHKLNSLNSLNLINKTK